MTMNAEATVREIVLKTITSEPKPALSPDDLLLDSGLIDSTGIMNLVSHFETEFGIQIEDTEIVPENFASVRAIVAFVEGKRRATGAAREG